MLCSYDDGLFSTIAACGVCPDQLGPFVDNTFTFAFTWLWWAQDRSFWLSGWYLQLSTCCYAYWDINMNIKIIQNSKQLCLYYNFRHHRPQYFHVVVSGLAFLVTDSSIEKGRLIRSDIICQVIETFSPCQLSLPATIVRFFWSASLYNFFSLERMFTIATRWLCKVVREESPPFFTGLTRPQISLHLSSVLPVQWPLEWFFILALRFAYGVN